MKALSLFIPLFQTVLSPHLMATAETSAQKYEIIDLGVIEGREEDHYLAKCINNRGQVAGDIWDASAKPRYSDGIFIWDATGGMRNIDYSFGNTWVWVQDFNNHGLILGSTRERVGTGWTSSFFWEETHGLTHQVAEGLEGIATSLTNHGKVLFVPRPPIPNDPPESEFNGPTILNGSERTILRESYPTLMRAVAMNEYGDWVGWSQDGELLSNTIEFKNYPFPSGNPPPQLQPVFPRPHSLEAHAITGSRLVFIREFVDFSKTQIGGGMPAIYQHWIYDSSGTWTQVALPSGYREIRTNGINSSGEIVGGGTLREWSAELEDRGIEAGSSWGSKIHQLFASTFNWNQEIALYWRGDSVFELQDFVVDMKDWNSLEAAHDINEAGWIVGMGTKDGKSRAFLLRPIEE
ncbi:MAG: hypothetical protein KC931_06020 [Candidatus Omnitrophica bacterium]|nr:hypothetical protein [Candidatus Omnitrophota bacterium]